MTSKLKFIEAACVTFNCTHSVVLSALSGKANGIHTELKSQIREFAAKACGADTAEWAEFVAAIEPNGMADKMLWALTTGAEIKL